MKAQKLARLIGRSVARAPRPFALSVFGITVGIAALSFFLALSLGMQRRVLSRIFPIGRVEVVPPRTSLDTGALGALDTLGSLLGGGPQPLGDSTISALRAHPDVALVSPRMKVSFAVRGWGGEKIVGRTVGLELFIDGIDPQAITEPTSPAQFRDYEDPHGPFCTEDKNCREGTYCSWDRNQCEPPVPVLISPFLMELYNGSIAKTHGLPRINGFLLGQLRGTVFTAELGKSWIPRTTPGGTPRQRKMMLVGVSDQAMPLGITVPLPYVKRWNALYAGERASREFSSLTVQIKEGRSPTGVVDLVRKLGYTVEDNGAEQAGLAVTLITALFVLVSLSTLVVAAGSVTHTFFRAISERRHELGVMRAVGASRLDIFLLLLGEAVLIGLIGGVLGLGIARLFAIGIDYLSRVALPEFPFKPTSYFWFSAGLCLLSVGFSILTCLLGALWPARAAARLSPAAALSSRA